jgi:hypothetical protein
VFAADHDRERAAAALREHYVRGRLTTDELSERMASVVAARSGAELRGALSGLPMLPDVRELAARARLSAKAVVRGAMLALFTGAYLLFSFALLFALGLTAALHGVSGTALVGFLVVWLVPTYLLMRVWHRKPRAQEKQR